MWGGILKMVLITTLLVVCMLDGDVTIYCFVNYFNYNIPRYCILKMKHAIVVTYAQAQIIYIYIYRKNKIIVILFIEKIKLHVKCRWALKMWLFRFCKRALFFLWEKQIKIVCLLHILQISVVESSSQKTSSLPKRICNNNE